jgi:hypothetical protein
VGDEILCEARLLNLPYGTPGVRGTRGHPRGHSTTAAIAFRDMAPGIVDVDVDVNGDGDGDGDEI